MKNRKKKVTGEKLLFERKAQYDEIIAVCQKKEAEYAHLRTCLKRADEAARDRVVELDQQTQTQYNLLEKMEEINKSYQQAVDNRKVYGYMLESLRVRQFTAKEQLLKIEEELKKRKAFERGLNRKYENSVLATNRLGSELAKLETQINTHKNSTQEIINRLEQDKALVDETLELRRSACFQATNSDPPTDDTIILNRWSFSSHPKGAKYRKYFIAEKLLNYSRQQQVLEKRDEQNKLENDFRRLIPSCTSNGPQEEMQRLSQQKSVVETLIALSDQQQQELEAYSKELNYLQKNFPTHLDTEIVCSIENSGATSSDKPDKGDKKEENDDLAIFKSWVQKTKARFRNENPNLHLFDYDATEETIEKLMQVIEAIAQHQYGGTLNIGTSIVDDDEEEAQYNT